MTFIADRIKSVVTDSERNITITPIYRYTGSTTSYPYLCKYNGIDFEFETSITYENRVSINKEGKERNRSFAINAYIIENNLMKNINETRRKLNLENVTEMEYINIKMDLIAAINLLEIPQSGVSFINSPIDKGLVDNPRQRINRTQPDSN